MTRFLFLFAVLALSVFGSNTAYCENITSVIDRNRPDQNPVTAPTQTTEAPVIKDTVKHDEIIIKPFVVTGASIQGSSLPTSLFDTVIAPYIGQTVDGDKVNEIADKIGAAYAATDIALYTVAVPKQDFAGGVIKLVVIEGWIAHITIQGDVDHDLGLVQSYAAQLTAEKPLTRSSLERYLSLMRDIPGFTVDVQLLKGDHVGETQLILTVAQKNFDFTFGVDNQGTAALDQTQMEGDVFLNSLFGEGDQTRLAVAAPVDIERFRYYEVVHSEPIGDEGVTAQVNAAYLRTNPAFTDLKGKAYSGGLQLSAPLIRSYMQNLYLTGGVDGLNSENGLFGTTISDERTRAVRLAMAYSDQDPIDLVTLAPTVSVGINGLGAHVMDPAVSTSSFTKANMQAGVNHLLGREFVLRFRSSAQYSPDRLPASEQFALGGAEYGRAFETASVSGDYGVAGSTEIAWHPLSWVPDLLKGSELYSFVDGGRLWYAHRLSFSTQHYSLASAGAGLRVALTEKISFQMQVARALVNPIPGRDAGTRLIFGFKTVY